MKLLLVFLAPCLFGQAISSQWYVYNIEGNPFNSEAQCDKPANNAVSGGVYTILVKSQTVSCGDQFNNLSTYNFTSGGMQFNTTAFQYGVIQFSVTTPNALGAGIWPVVWMQGINCQLQNKLAWFAGGTSPCQWPAPGSDEIDIAEWFGSNQVSASIHSNGNNVQMCGVTTAPNTTYVIRMDWSAGLITRTVNGVQDCNYSNANVPSSTMFVMITFALGGISGTVPGGSLPLTLTVDYMRVCPTGTVTCDAAHASIFDDEFTGSGSLASANIEQTFQGNATGLSSTDAFGVLNNQQVSWPNDPGYCTDGQIGPGTILNLYGTFSTTLIANCGGTSGNNIIFCKEAGSSVTINTNSQSNVLIQNAPCSQPSAGTGISLGGPIVRGGPVSSQ